VRIERLDIFPEVLLLNGHFDATTREIVESYGRAEGFSSIGAEGGVGGRVLLAQALTRIEHGHQRIGVYCENSVLWINSEDVEARTFGKNDKKTNCDKIREDLIKQL
jgi:hypothetical protein